MIQCVCVGSENSQCVLYCRDLSIQNKQNKNRKSKPQNFESLKLRYFWTDSNDVVKNDHMFSTKMSSPSLTGFPLKYPSKGTNILCCGFSV